MRNLFITILVGIAFAIPTLVSAQPDIEWEHLYGQRRENGRQQRTWLYSMTTTSSGGYTLAGEYWNLDADEDVNNHRFFLIVTDSVGEVLWSNLYGDEEARIQTCIGVTESPDGGILMVGRKYSDGFIVKVDENGEEEWYISYEDEGRGWFSDVVVVGDSAFVIGGTNQENGSKIWLMKIDLEGDIIWSETYNSGESSTGGLLIATSDGGFALGGSTVFDDERNRDGMLMKVDADGEEEWTSTFGTELDEWSGSIVQTPDGGFAAAGKMETLEMISTSDFYLTRLNADGELLWSNTYGNGVDDANEACYGITYSSLDGGFILVGEGRLGNYGLRIVRTDNFGNELWTKNILGDSKIGLRSVVELPDYSYVVAGTADRAWIDGEPDLESFYLAKTYPDSLVYGSIEIISLADTIHFSEVWLDSSLSDTLLLTNLGERFGMIDSVTIESENDSAFIFPFIENQKLFPFDTLTIPITFTPREASAYFATLHFWQPVLGADTVAPHLEVVLTGEGKFNGVDDRGIELPTTFAITSVYPNPFNSSLNIEYSINFSQEISITAYNTAGQMVAQLFSGQQTAGNHSIQWQPERLSTGVYYIQIENSERIDLTKAVFLK